MPSQCLPPRALRSAIKFELKIEGFNGLIE